MGFPKITDNTVGVPKVSAIVYWDLYWNPPIQGNYNIVSK